MWASGILSPVYCDNRLTISYPAVRRILTDAFVDMASGHEFDCIAGVATGGIPHASWVADRMSLPMVYVRSEAKGHGKQNQIEGNLPEHSRVLVIEDLVTTGRSSIRVLETIRETTKVAPALILAIFSYQLEGVSERFQKTGTPLKTLSNFDILLDVAIKIGHIDSKFRNSLLEWRRGLRVR